MKTKNISILGSTGSIGRSTLDVITKHPGAFNVIALAAFSNVELLAEQCHKFQPRYACLVDSDKKGQLESKLKDFQGELLYGEGELVNLAKLEENDLVVNAVVGSAGLLASLEAVKNGIDLALANKESLVTGGPLFNKILKKTGAKILPIDSEHSAIWQALAAGKPDEIKRLIITASGGPFRTMPQEEFGSITPEKALDHPTWKMGPKITIDSATLANKGLEVIEAVNLFNIPVEKVSVVVHPQSIIHSMVEFIDSSIIAQLSKPDMRLPITYALFWPDRVKSDYGSLDITQSFNMTMEPPDMNKFKALKISFEVARIGGTAPAVFNAANEIAVDAFLKKRIKFTDITDTIEKVVDTFEVNPDPELEDILKADHLARAMAYKIVENLHVY
ncbi:MAG: 1-deoxy-D-xylulose-5-phosphate reductoisomerase [bacterium]